MKNGLFPNMGNAKSAAFNSVDAPLWYFWAVQQYHDFCNDGKEIWATFGKKMIAILDGYRKGLTFNIKMHDNGLIWAGEKGYALTWMDAVVNGKPVTPRIGYPVEINALWYNAIMFTMEMAQKNGDNKFVKEWQPIASTLKSSFNKTFWIPDKGYLADYVDEKQHDILFIVDHVLFTPKGLRTLSPQHPEYKGKYEGDQATRDKAYHQGTAWPWLLAPFIKTQFNLFGKSAIPQAQGIIDSFVEDITGHGICSISEIYDGDPPHHPRGAISQAWSIAAIIEIKRLIDQYSNSETK